MKKVGIIVEYNPMTNGHLYHIQKVRELTHPDVLIAVMSGNFSQRGEPCIVDKWQRTKCAIENGVDLVVELPFVFACEGQDYFSKGAISTLNMLGVDMIVFGSESYTKKDYEALYNKTLDPVYNKQLQDYLKQGYSYPASTFLAFNQDLNMKPNDLLGFSYVKEIKRQNLKMDYMTIQRSFDYHSDTNTSPSASFIRKEVLSNNDVSFYSPMTLKPPFHQKEDLFYLLYSKLSLSNLENLSNYHLVTEGIQYLFKNKIDNANSIEEFVNLVETKRYSRPRILRTIVHLLLEDTLPSRNQLEVEYVRLLGYSVHGQPFIKQIKKDCPVPFINQFTQLSSPYLDLELKATILYYLPFGKEAVTKAIHQEKYQICLTQNN